MISTPCIKICVMENDLCVGCGRTLGEIASWGSMREVERRAIMDILPARLAKLDANNLTVAKEQADQNEKYPEGEYKLTPRPCMGVPGAVGREGDGQR